jgi:hypothetical protein
LSYREGFPAFDDSDVRSDFGWGCALRSAQMLVANALMIEKFGRGEFNSNILCLVFRLDSHRRNTFAFGQPLAAI